MIFGGVNKKMSEKAVCKHCKSENVYGMSRVVGYYSIIENWNDSKQAELRDRQRGMYKLGEKPAEEISHGMDVCQPHKIKVSAD